MQSEDTSDTKTHSNRVHRVGGKLRKTLVDAIFKSPTAHVSLNLLKTPNYELVYTSLIIRPGKAHGYRSPGSQDQKCPFRNLLPWFSFLVMTKCLQSNALAEMNIFSEQVLFTLDPAPTKGFLVPQTMNKD